MLRDLKWGVSQRELFSGYAAVVVASGHMSREYARNGVAASRIHTNPLFPTRIVEPAASTWTPWGSSSTGTRPPGNG